MHRNVFIILTHFINPRIEKFIDRASRELAGRYDVRVLGYFPISESIPDEFASHPLSIACTRDSLRELQIPSIDQDDNWDIYKRGNLDLPILWFANRHPDYHTFWVFEGDVEYSGSIGEFVSHLEQTNSDLLLTRLGVAPKDWPNFYPRTLPAGWPNPENSRTYGFLPVFRASREFLEAAQRFFALGGSGHNEWVWPQVALMNELECRDIADFKFHGRSLYTCGPKLGRRSLGSFRYRPPMSAPGRRKNTLWHPVKDRPISVLNDWIRPLVRIIHEMPSLLRK